MRHIAISTQIRQMFRQNRMRKWRIFRPNNPPSIYDDIRFEAHCNHLTAIPVTSDINIYDNRIFTEYHLHTNWLDVDLRLWLTVYIRVPACFISESQAGPTLAYQNSGADQGRLRMTSLFQHPGTSVTIMHAIAQMHLYLCLLRSLYSLWQIFT